MHTFLDSRLEKKLKLFGILNASDFGLSCHVVLALDKQHFDNDKTSPKALLTSKLV